MKIIGFSGSRGITFLRNRDKIFVDSADVVIHGGTDGYDALIDDYAREKNKQVIIIRPKDMCGDVSYLEKWKIRNKIIVELSHVMCFGWDGLSKGTQFTMGYYIDKMELDVKKVETIAMEDYCVYQTRMDWGEKTLKYKI